LDNCLVRSPVIVRIDNRAIGIVQFKHRVEQRVGYAEGAKRWADAADNDARSSGPSSQDKSADHNIVAGLDEPARADVGQFGGFVGIEIIAFNQGDSGGVVNAADNRRLSAWI
jgi:hypothetical protein